MKTTKNKIISRSEIDQYSSLSESQKNALEKELDAFDQDALDGFQESGRTTSSMKKLDQKFNKTTQFNWWTIGGVAVSIAFFVTLYLLNKNESAIQQKPIYVETSEKSLPKHIDSLTTLPENKQITAQIIHSSQKGIEETSTNKTEESFETDEIIIPEIYLEPLPAEIETPKQPVKSQKFAKEIYLKDFKTIDYREFRSKTTLPIEMTLLTGTPANIENNDASKEDEVTQKTVEIPYIDYLEKSLDYVNKGKWKQALVRFEEIISTYPDDINARFYAGMCYYNLKQYEKAYSEFSTCLQLPYSNFNEEAEWYFVKSKINAKETEEAKVILSQIIEQKGYYSKQAEKLLKTL